MPSNPSDLTHARINAICEEIARLQRELRHQVLSQPSDREALDIIMRVERALKSKPKRK